MSFEKVRPTMIARNLSAPRSNAVALLIAALGGVMERSEIGWFRRAICAAPVFAVLGVASSVWAQTRSKPGGLTGLTGPTR
jgi:hypothetical protein